MEPESRKRRFSNFDITPDQLSKSPLVSSFVSAQYSNINTGYSIDDFLGESVSVVDRVFKERLEKALEKNFEFIIRVESQIEAAKLNVANYASSHPMKQFASYSAAGISTASGLGASKLIAQMNQQMAKNQQESVSVYVSNLPLDITEEELEVLFGTVSSVAAGPRVKQPVKPLKRIRLYTDSVTGKKKGDALLTFSRPELAKMAVSRFNEMDIGDGFVIKVVRADFNQNNQGSSKKEEEHEALEGDDTDWDDSSRPRPPPPPIAPSDVRSLSELRAGSSSSATGINAVVSESNDRQVTAPSGPDLDYLYASLPPECEASTHPVVVILNLYDNASLTSFVLSFTDGSLEDGVSKYFEDLEADVLVECCAFGRIRFIQVLDLAEQVVSQWGGGLAVTFDTVEAARECAEVFGKRRTNGKAVTAVVVLPSRNSSSARPGAVKNKKDSTDDITSLESSEFAVFGVPSAGLGFSAPSVSSAPAKYTPLDQLPSHIPPPPPPPKFVRSTATSQSVSVANVAPIVDAPIVDTDKPLVESELTEGVVDVVEGDDLDVDSFLNSLL